MAEDTRWHQRFDQFDRAFRLLQQALAIESPSVVERAGVVQFFEISLELAWKLLKDYQEAEGYSIASPRDAIKQAFQSGLVADGHGWINALTDRNLTTHTYNEKTAVEVDDKIRGAYFPLLLALHASFAEKVGD